MSSQKPQRSTFKVRSIRGCGRDSHTDPGGTDVYREPPGHPSPLGGKAHVLPGAHRPLRPALLTSLSVPSPSLLADSASATWASSVFFQHTCCCPRTFAYAVPTAQTFMYLAPSLRSTVLAQISPPSGDSPDSPDLTSIPVFLDIIIPFILALNLVMV